jgi:DNA invertase Pin-like site-specific DNA recombinase
MTKIQSTHRIAYYIRVSTEEQAENPEGSIKNQEERLKATVQYKNQEGLFGECVAVYTDRARSGKDTNRPELQRLLQAIRRKEVTLVMVTELSRLSRSIKDFAGIWELMQACSCSFMSLRENFDTTTAAGEMVLYSVANIAQFERRQISERVTAGFQSRAKRGLYNGGPVPYGYRLAPDHPGTLDIHPEHAPVVQAAFRAFLEKGNLSLAAKWLNAQGYTMARARQGGGANPRLGHFMVENLSDLLKRKAYAGVRTYLDKGESKETKAAWPPIIDDLTFHRVQVLLKQNQKRKPESEARYPFALTGLTACASCGERMVGKSAHGNGGKVPYYEHGWATKREGCTVKQAFTCQPFRVQAKRLEPKVWEKINELLSTPATVRLLLDEAQAIHVKKSNGSDRVRIQAKIQALKSQQEVLAERLAELPPSISPAPVFKQMEKIEAAKTLQEDLLKDCQAGNKSFDMPTALSSYDALLTGLNRLATSPNAEATRYRILQALIHRIEITPDGFRLHHYVGRNHVERELEALKSETPGVSCEIRAFSQEPLFYLKAGGSNSLQNGWSDRD